MKRLRHLLRQVSPGSTSAKASQRPRNDRNQKRRLLSEALESRQLLAGDVDIAPAHNYWEAEDVNNDKRISALDALTVINHLNSVGSAEGEPITGENTSAFLDVNADRQVTALDALRVINRLNSPEGEAVGKLVEFVLTARELDDTLVDNTGGFTDVLPQDPDDAGFENENAGPLTYNVDVGDVFKLEVAVQDLRGNSAFGVFQVINDLLVSETGAIDLALTQVQDLTFDLRLLDATTGNIDISFAGNEANGRSVPISDFFSGSSDEQRAANFADLLVGISSDLNSTDDVEVIASRNNSGGPNDAGFFTYSVRYTGTEFVNRNDLPALNVDFSITDGALPRTFTDEQDLVAQIFNPRNPDSSVNQTAFERSIENISRNSNGFGIPLELYGAERVFGTVDGVTTVPVTGETDQILFLDDFGALGPTTNLPTFLTPFGGFDNTVGYDSISIPVIASSAATNVRVGLSGDVSGDGVLIYGTGEGKEGVPVGEVELDEDSFFFLNIAGDTTNLDVAVGQLPVMEDDADGETLDLNTLLNNGTTPFTFTLTGADGGAVRGAASIDSNGILTYTPDLNENGSDTIAFTVEDANSLTGSGTVNVTISAENDDPVANDDDATIDLNLNSDVLINVLANDTDVDGDTLTVTMVTQPTGGTAAIQGNSILYTPNAATRGDDVFTYTISDGTVTASATVTVDVSSSATGLTADDDTVTLTEVEDDTSEQVLVTNLNNLVNINSGSTTVVFSIDTANSDFGESPASARIVTDASGSQLLYTPAANDFGMPAAQIVYTATNDAGTDSGTITVNIDGVNDNPIAVEDNFSVNEMQTLDLDVLANDTDGPFENGTLTITDVSTPQRGVATIINNGTQIRYQSTAAASAGDDSFTYTISDNEGGTAFAVVNIDIVDVLTAPIAGDDTRTAIEGGDPITIELNDPSLVTIDNGDTVTFDIVSVNPASATSQVVRTGSEVTFTPDADSTETVTFTYEVESTQSGLSDTGVITIDITAVNDPPTASPLTFTVLEDSFRDINLIDGGSDPENDTLTASVATQPSNGALTDQGNGVFRYTPNANFNGSDSFTYTVNDGTSDSNTATVSLTITDTVQAPIATDGTLDAVEAGPAVTLELSLLVDLDPGDSPTYTVTQPTNGTASVTTSGLLTFTPADSDFFGSDSLQYTVTNATGSDTGTISITIADVNDPPVAVDDTAQTTKNQSVTIDVLDNDSLGPANENDTATLSVFSAPANGSVNLVNNEFVYTPNTDFTGDDSFTYTLSDGDDTDTATVSITVSDFETSEIRGQLFVDAYDNVLEVIQSGGTIPLTRNGIRDLNETVLSGVSVILRSIGVNPSTGTEIVRTAITNLKGEYVFDEVPPGQFEVVYDLPEDAVTSTTETQDGVVPVAVGTTSSVMTESFVFYSLGEASNGNRPILSNNRGADALPAGVEASEVTRFLLDEAGIQQLIQMNRAFNDAAGFEDVTGIELALNAQRDQALLTVVRRDAPDLIALVGSSQLRASEDGRAVELLGGLEDFDYQANLDAVIASDFAGFGQSAALLEGRDTA
ncbi:MAG: Ig-like domain-containing protein [Planctomycetota bacterium]